MSKQVKCKSGLMGWRNRLQKNYTSFSEFDSYCRAYGLHERLGFKTPEEAWDANPMIEGSVNPGDLRVVKLKRYPKKVVIAHARKMNTRAAARRLAQVDSGAYKISH